MVCELYLNKSVIRKNESKRRPFKVGQDLHSVTNNNMYQGHITERGIEWERNSRSFHSNKGR